MVRAHLRHELRLLVLATLLPVWLGCAFLIWQIQANAEHLIERDTELTVRTMLDVVDRELIALSRVVAVLATTPSLQQDDLRAFHTAAAEAMVPTGHTLVLLDAASGKELLDTSVEFPGALPLRSEFVPQKALTQRRGDLSHPYIDVISGQRKTAIEIPTFRAGQARYVLSVAILPEQMAAILKSRQLPDGWVGSIFDSDGVLFARSRVADLYVGRRITDRLFRATRDASSGTFDGYTLDNVHATTLFARSPLSGWGATISIPVAQLQSRLLGSIAWSILGVSAFAALSLVCAQFAGRRIALAFRHAEKAREASIAGLRQVEENARVRAMLFAHLSHTMHTPLQVIVGTADLLVRSRQDAKTADYCERIQRAVLTVDQLIDEIIEQNERPVAQLNG